MSRVKFYDAFCGAGGLSFGLMQAGWKPIGAFDKDPIAVRTYEENIGVPPEILDAFSIDLDALSERVDADALVGCPPCQGFSSLRRSRFGEDARNDLVTFFAELIVRANPEIVLFENVPGVLGDFRFRKLIRFLEKRGYKLTYAVVNAADYGVPQKRRRLILVASTSLEPAIPEPDHGPPTDKDVRKCEKRPWVTVREAIADLPPLNVGEESEFDPLHRVRKLPEHYIRLIKAIPKNGGSRFDAPRELWLPTHRRAGRKYPDVFGRLIWDSPSVTITTGFTNPSKGRFVHPEQNRGLSLREGARLQTFPDDYEFEGSFARIERQIGEAFPPLLAEKIAETLR